MKFRRMLSTTAAVAMLSTIAVVSPAAADDDDDHVLRMTNSDEMSMVRGSNGWINIGLTSRAELQNVRIIVRESDRGTEVTYPGYGNSAGLSQGSVLPSGGMDVARFRLSTTSQSDDEIELDIIAEWEQDGRFRRAEIGEIEVELRNYRGADYEFLNRPATVSSTGDGAGNWVEMDFLGIAPINSDFEVRVKKGLDEVYYPQGTYTSLHHDDRLDSGETDVARIWIDPATVAPGTYTVEIEVKYKNNRGRSSRQTHEMTITVN